MGTTAEKLTYLNETKTQLKDMLNLGGASLTTEPFRQYVDTLKNRYLYFMNNGTQEVWDNWEKVVGEGTTITLNNTEEAPMKIVLKGNTSQETTTGKNLFSGNYSQFDSTGGEGTTYAYFKLPDDNKQYTLTMIAKNDFTTNSNTYLGFTGTGGSGKGGVNWVISQLSGTITKGTIISKISTTSNNRFVSLYNKGANYLKKLVDNFYIQLEEGETATDYEEYTGGQPSPSPDYPQEIHTVSGENSVKIQNKNLFDESAISSNPNVIINSQGFYEGTASNIISYFNNNFKNYNYKANTQYTIAYTSYGSASNINARFVVHYTDNTIQNWNITSSTTPTSIIYRSTSDKTIDYISFVYGNSGTVYIKNIMMVEGNYISSTMPPYVSHQEQTYPLSLGDLEYCKIGDYEDSFIRNSGKNSFNRTTASENVALIWSTGNTYEQSNSISSDYIVASAGDKFISNYVLNVYAYDSSKTYIGTLNNNGLAKTTGDNYTNFTLPNDNSIAYIRLSWRTANNNNANMNNQNIMLNTGTVLEEYEPYGSGKWYLKKNAGKVVLDGSEDWVIFNSSSLRVTFRTIINGIEGYTNGNTIPNIISNRFIPNSYNATWVIGNVSRTTSSGGQNFVLFVYEPNTTVEQFKTWLSSNNIIAYYVLATPTYTLLSETLQTQLEAIWRANSYEDQTNVSQTNADLPFVISASAIRDLSGIFELIQG